MGWPSFPRPPPSHPSSLLPSPTLQSPCTGRSGPAWANLHSLCAGVPGLAELPTAAQHLILQCRRDSHACDLTRLMPQSAPFNNHCVIAISVSSRVMFLIKQTVLLFKFSRFLQARSCLNMVTINSIGAVE